MTQNRRNIIVMEKFIGIRINEENQIVAKKENGEGIILGDYRKLKDARAELNEILRAYAENRVVDVMKGEQ